LKDRVAWIETGIVELNGDASFEEVNAELGKYCLHVEALSEKKTISQFIKEGGLGYNSLREGTFGSKILQVTASFSGKEYSYGCKYKTLYNAGYPLHRIIEGPLFSRRLAQRFGRVESVIMPVKIAASVELSFQKNTIDALHVPDYASNVFFTNDFGAELIGLAGEGIVTAYRHGINLEKKMKAEVWERRFLEDLIPHDHEPVKFLTIKSRLKEIYNIFKKNAQGLFFALWVRNGILLLMSGEKKQLNKLVGDIRPLPLTFEIKG
jgi:hypothetical protein